MAKKKGEQGEQGDQEQAQKKKKGWLKWILLLVIILVLGGGGYYAYNKYFASSPDQDNNNATTEQASAKQEEADSSNSQMISIDPFVVNLADPLGKRFLKVALDLEVKNSKVASEVDQNMPKIKDSLLLLLSSKSYSQLASMEKKILLKREIIKRLNQILGKSKVLAVYFTEFVIQ